MQTFPLDSLDPKDPTAALKRGKRISSHTTFFKAGQCLGRTIVCIVKSSPLSTTIKTMDPVEAPVKKKPQGAAFSKLMPNRHDTLKVFKVSACLHPLGSISPGSDVFPALPSSFSARRSSTSPPSRARFTSSRRDSASDARRGSRLSTSRRSTPRVSSIQQIPTSSSSTGETTRDLSDRWPSTGSRETSCFVTTVSPRSRS